jgi:hypothetical protein
LAFNINGDGRSTRIGKPIKGLEPVQNLEFWPYKHQNSTLQALTGCAVQEESTVTSNKEHTVATKQMNIPVYNSSGQEETMDKKIFDKLLAAKNSDEISVLFTEYRIPKKDKNKYPDLHFTISQTEIGTLKSKGIITGKNTLAPDVSANTELSSLEKLLYAVIWKNGDLAKIQHIISGICGDPSGGLVFNQFGKHLNNRNEPIIDQHVLRAFIYHQTGEKIKDIKDKHILKYSTEYRNWINSNEVLRNNMDMVDGLLFSIGKKLKKEC